MEKHGYRPLGDDAEASKRIEEARAGIDLLIDACVAEITRRPSAQMS